MQADSPSVTGLTPPLAFLVKAIAKAMRHGAFLTAMKIPRRMRGQWSQIGHSSLPGVQPLPLDPTREALRTTAVYALLALAWITIGDYLLTTHLVSPEAPWWQHSLKGLAFVLITSAALYGLLRSALQREHRLRETAEAHSKRLRMALQGTGAATWIYEAAPDGQPVGSGRMQLSSELKALAGRRPQEAPHDLEGWMALVHTDDRKKMERLGRRAIRERLEEVEIGYRIQHSDGTWRWLRTRARREQAPDGSDLWLGIVWDVTAEHRSTELGDLLTSLFDNAREGILVLSDSSRILRANATIAGLFHTRAERLEGQRFDAALLGLSEPQVLREALRAARHRSHWFGEFGGHKVDGANCVWSLRISVVHSSEGGYAGFLVILNDVSDEADIRERLRLLTHFDPITGLPNAAHFRELANEELATGASRQRVLLTLDLDRFQPINETFGTSAGDVVLAEYGTRLQRLCSTGGTASRTYGDSFAVLSPPLADETAVTAWLQQLERAMAQPISLQAQSLRLTFSAGAAVWPGDGTDAAVLQAHAETALSRARAAGGNCLLRYKAAYSRASAQEIALEEALRTALDEDEIDCYLQPIVALDDGRVLGAEALARWRHDGQWISPAAFASMAETRGMASALAEAMLRRSAEAVRHLQAVGHLPEGFRISVNLSALQVDAKLPAFIFELLRRHDMPASHLCLELTESAVMQHPDIAIPALDELRTAGITLSLDDFGTGYSSLTQLQRLPLDFLKLDRDFVGRLPDDEASLEIVRAIIALARTLELQTIGEGVETTAQRDCLRALGCDAMQGFLLLPGVAPLEFARWLVGEATTQGEA